MTSILVQRKEHLKNTPESSDEEMHEEISVAMVTELQQKQNAESLALNKVLIEQVIITKTINNKNNNNDYNNGDNNNNYYKNYNNNNDNSNILYCSLLFSIVLYCSFLG